MKHGKEHPYKKSTELAKGIAMGVLEPTTVKHEESGAYGAQGELAPEKSFAEGGKPRRINLEEQKKKDMKRPREHFRTQQEHEKQLGYK